MCLWLVDNRLECASECSRGSICVHSAKVLLGRVHTNQVNLIINKLMAHLTDEKFRVVTEPTDEVTLLPDETRFQQRRQRNASIMSEATPRPRRDRRQRRPYDPSDAPQARVLTAELTSDFEGNTLLLLDSVKWSFDCTALDFQV